MRLRRLGITLVALVLLASGCHRFAVVGDSVTFRASRDLAGRGALVEAAPGITIRQARPVLRRFAADRHVPVVVAVGTVDVGFEEPLRRLEFWTKVVLRNDLAGVPCVIWVELSENSTVLPGWTERAAAFNDMLERQADRHGARIAPWSVAALRHPEWFVRDGVHLSREGVPAYGRFLTRAVDRLC